ncbi:flagellar protein FliT [Dyella mobilis]|uniref:Flagellar protein FliT n=1 Tax=Dyella mobilis TaxID=1849582 RepID=A0ABS2KAX3_9GAMM|nr:flagellar protein FliT [Dyella mobilis]MBM7128104.1 flagellar protein FliT [Dyella mobilis]GLQ99920.1 hypothetical protein GCM10007863_43400 [Dyella mobilis]
MKKGAHPNVQQALRVTQEMLDAANVGNWDRVSQLDAERHRLLQTWKPVAATPADRDAITALQNHNQTLMAHAEAARAAVKQELDQHQYNHRALATYISSASLR